MPDYRRSKVEGGTYFFTVVTYNRHPLFASDEARQILHAAWANTQHRFPFITDAVCLLPDHLHCIWTLPDGDDRYSVRWKEIKRLFTKEFLARGGSGGNRNESRMKRGEAAVWQRRFWEHRIRDDRDYYQHIEYIHYNPVKHKLVSNPADWPWTSLHRFIDLGYCEKNWGVAVNEEIDRMGCGE